MEINSFECCSQYVPALKMRTVVDIILIAAFSQGTYAVIVICGVTSLDLSVRVYCVVTGFRESGRPLSVSHPCGSGYSGHLELQSREYRSGHRVMGFVSRKVPLTFHRFAIVGPFTFCSKIGLAIGFSALLTYGLLASLLHYSSIYAIVSHVRAVLNSETRRVDVPRYLYRLQQ